jgi:hypothetical protein
MGFRYGKKPPRRLMGVPALSDFMAPAASWPAVKPWGWEYALPDGDLNILGNDVVGNCGPCGALHLLQTQAASLKNQILTPTLEDALALYSAVGGYDPNAPLNPDGSNPTDQGVDLLTLLQYWKNTGITVGGVKHTIRGFASLDLSSVAQMRYAGYLFGGLYLGINCPQSAEDDTSDWQYVPGSPVAGGHCINLAGEGSLGTHIQSWGMNIPTSWDFLLHQLDEGYVVLTDIWVDAQDEAPSGVDINGLLAAMSRIGATGG